MFSCFNTQKVYLKGLQYLALASMGFLAQASVAGFDCEYNLSANWGSGAVAAVTITNMGAEVAEWNVIRVTFPSDVVIVRRWNNQPIAPGEKEGTFYPLAWNKTLAPGQVAEVGMQLRFASGYPLGAPTLSGDCDSMLLNSGPVAEFSAVAEVGEFEGTLYVDASASYDLDDEALTYAWYLNGEKQNNETAITTFYVAAGAYEITLSVSDGTLSAQQTQSINVGTIFTADIQQEMAGLSVMLDASGSSSSDQIIDYLWDFGDGVSGQGALVNHLYASAGTYNVTLTLVSASENNVSTIEISVADNDNLPPVVDFNCREHVLIAEMFTINAAVSQYSLECVSASTDPDGDSLSYHWQTGEGVTLSRDSRFSRAFVNGGELEIILTVSDSVHSVELTQLFLITGNGVPPTGTLNCTTQLFDSVCVIEATDADSDVNVAIMWGDGVVQRVEPGEISHRYTEPGEYTITLNIWDKSNAEQLTHNVVIVSEKNTPPTMTDLTCTANELISENPELGAAIVQNLSDCFARVEDAEGDPLQLTWDFGDGAEAILSDRSYGSYLYEAGGTYTITLTASDGINTVADSIEFEALGNGEPIQPKLTCTTEGLTVSCSVAGFYPDGSSQNAAIIWGDGENSRYVGGNLIHTYVSPGDYEIMVYVWSKHRVGSSLQSVSLSNARPDAVCEYDIVGSWGDYFQAEIRITNSSDKALADWAVEWTYDDGSHILVVWGGELSGSNPYRIVGYDWNASLAPGESAVVGLRGTFDGELPRVPVIICN